MLRHYGIVLRRYAPKKSKIIVLDRELGKIESIPHIDRLCHGAVIDYFPKKMRLLYRLDSVQLIAMPFDLAQEHIHFVHHILELAHYFIPLDSRVPEIFDLILFLYRIEKKVCTTMFQKLFVSKFFILLGLFPEDEKMKHPYFHQLLTRSIDSLSTQYIQLEHEHVLQEWIYKCIAQHPRARYFKTVQWFNTGGTA